MSQNWSKINRQSIIAYQKKLAEDLNLSPATVKRRLSSIKKFCEWAQKEGYLQENPFKTQEELPEKITYTPNKLKSSLSKAYKAYHNIPVTKYFHWAILIIFCAALGYGAYDQFFKKVPSPFAFPTSLTRPNRFLSFQGRLTDSSDNPISSATNIAFKLWNVSSSGDEGTCTGAAGEECLWTSSTCSVTPDQDGIFSIILGTTSGDGYTCSSAIEVPATVFSENQNIYLGVKVASDSEMTPRIQVATVGYALNAETLQGYPPGTGTNSIPYINNAGDILIAAASPMIQGSSGTFAIEGQTGVTIQAGTGVGGNITIAPKGDTGTVNLTPQATTGNLLNNQSGANFGTVGGKEANNLFYGYAGTDSTNLNLLKLEAGATPDAKFTIDASGNASAAGTLKALSTAANALDVAGGIYAGSSDTFKVNTSGNITGGQWQSTAIATQYGGTGQDFSATAQGNILYFSGAGTMAALSPGTSGYVLQTNGASSNPSWVDLSSTAGPWTLSGTNLFPDLLTYNVGIGNSTPANKLSVSGNADISGNLGIGTTGPGQKLSIEGGNVEIRSGKSLMVRPAGNDWDYRVASLGSGSSAIFYLASGDAPTTPLFVMNSSGNVGIGTTNPTSLFNVGASNQFAINTSGTITAGAWNGTAIGTQYGGTGQNWSAVAQGSLPYFNGAGTMTTLAPSTAGYVLQTNGAGANPSWVEQSGGTNYWTLSGSSLFPNLATYNVGIGTSTPQTKLDVAGTAWLRGSTSTSGLFVNSSGNVGIGTTSPLTKFTINNGATLSAGTNDFISIRAGGEGYLDTSRATILWSQDNGNTTLARFGTEWNLANSRIDFVWRDMYNGGVGSTELMRLTSAGNVGIGTAGPDRKLDVLDASSPQLRLTQADSTVYADFQMNSDGDLVVNVDGVSSQLVLDNGGNVGIGTVGPSVLLHVKKDQNVATGMMVQNATAGTGAYSVIKATEDNANKSLDIFHLNTSYTTSGIFTASTGYVDSLDTGGLALGARNAAGVIKFYTGGSTAANERVRIDSTGNVGIGTTTPTSLFSVGSSSQFQVDSSGDIVKLKNLTYSWPSAHTTNGFLNNNGSGTLAWTTIAGAGGVTGSGTAGYLPKWNTSSDLTNSVLYESGGNVGIGTTNPSSFKLQIAGNVGPETDDTYDLGSSSLNWGNIYLGGTILGKDSGAYLPSGTNLLKNAGFVDSNGDNLPDYWTILSTPTLVVAADTLFPALGGNQVTITAVGANQEGMNILGGSANWLKVKPSTTYTLSFDYKVTAGDNLRLAIQDYNGASWISVIFTISTLSSTTATRYSKTFTTSATATNLDISLRSVLDGDIVYVSHPKLEESAITTPYAERTLEVVEGGTGTTTGSITGTGALTFAAGGTNQNITLTPSGTGYTILNGYVGIGTTNPKDRLQVDSTSSNPLKLRVHTESSTNNDLAGIAFGVDTDNQFMKSSITHQRKGSNGMGDLLFLVDSNNDGANVAIGDEKMRITSAGNIGIGTTNPTAKLVNVGTTMLGTGLTSSEDALLVNVGTGFSGNLLKLSVNSTQKLAIDSTGQLITASGTFLSTVADSASAIAYNFDTLIAMTAPGAKLLSIKNAGSEKMSLDKDGVLALYNSESKIYNSSGDITIDAASGNVSFATNNLINVDDLTMGGTASISGTPNLTFIPTANLAKIYLLNGGDLGFYTSVGGDTGVSEKIRITNSGNIGIGTTNPGSYKLYVAGNVALNSGNIYTDSDNFIHAARFVDTSNSSYFVDPAAATSAVLSGNVGIGTISPVSALNVAGTTGITWAISGNSLGLVTIGTGGTSGGSLWVNTPSLNSAYHSGLGVTGTYGTPSQRSVINLNAYGVNSAGGYGSDFAFSTTKNGVLTEAMRIDQSGNVGIGKTSPSYKLDVSGDINFTGALREDGVEILSGMISAFTGSCPTGWSEYTAARGRTIVGTPSGGTGTGTVGTALTNLGTRTITDVPSHRHGITVYAWDPPGGGNVVARSNYQTGAAGGYTDYTGSASVDVTMPYIQLTYCQKSAGSDLAEWISASEDISKETIVSIDPDNREKIIASKKAYDSTVVGIIATQPGWLIGNESQDSVQMALSGRVPARVSLINGEIKPGDPITTSPITGVGMKATQNGPIVGKAMEALNETSSLTNCLNPQTGQNEKCGTILVFINISFFSPEESEFQQDTLLAQASNNYYELLRISDSLSEGDLVNLEFSQAPNEQNPSQMETISDISKASKGLSGSFVGVISNEINGRGDLLRRERVNNQIVSETRLIYGANTKVKISPDSEAILSGDSLVVSANPGMATKATQTGPTIGKALENWSPNSEGNIIHALIMSGWYDPDIYLTSVGDLEVTYDAQLSEEYQLKDGNGNLIERFGAFAEIAVANLKAGLIKTQELVAEKKIITPKIETERISLKEIDSKPGQDLIFNLKPDTGSTESSFGQLIVKGKEGETVASIDAEGNVHTEGDLSARSATFAGTLSASEATISGTLYADEIITKNGKFGDLLVNNIAKTETPVESINETEPATSSAILSEEEINNLINEILASAPEATAQAELSENINIPNDLLVSNSLNISGTMSLSDNALNTLGGPLYLQSLGLGGIDILAGKITIDEHGNAIFSENVTIKGDLAANTIRPLPEKDLVIDLAQIPVTTTNELGLEIPNESTQSAFGNLLVKGFNGQVVASIDASGSAYFTSIGINADYNATQSGTIIAAYDNWQTNGEYSPALKTNATAGVGILPANEQEIMIYNQKITDQSLIYITPIGDTQNKVLYVKAKKAHSTSSGQAGTESPEPVEGWFKVAIDTPINQDIKFNWWIVGGMPTNAE